MKVWTIEESTPLTDGIYETFMVCSSYELAVKVKTIYENSYPLNEYRTQEHVVLDDKRIIEIEQNNERED